jgi:hypothetical protein
MASVHGAQWDRDEEYRQSVIRKALLLGFECEEYELVAISIGEYKASGWRFMFDGIMRTNYPSCYSAAFDYLRLMEVPIEVIGDYRG